MVKVTTPGAWGASALELPSLTGPSEDGVSINEGV